MKNLHLILVFVMATMLSCKKEESLSEVTKRNDTITIYSETEFYKNKSSKIKVIDTGCIAEENRAKKDLANGIKIYTLMYGIGSYDFSNKEFGKQLSLRSIKLDSILKPCERPAKGFRHFCYANLMNSEIEKKFGRNFIDSLRKVSDREFVENHSNFVFDFLDCDQTSRYPSAKSYEEFLEKPENDFVRQLNYPKMSKKKQSIQKANVEIFFTIYKNGSVGNIKTEINKEISTNAGFTKYFENKAIEFVKNAKWNAAIYRGLKVNSTMHLNLYNK